MGKHVQELHAERYERYLDGEADSIIEAKRVEERERSGCVMRQSGRLSRPKRSISNVAGRTQPASELTASPWNGIPQPRAKKHTLLPSHIGAAPEVVLRDKLVKVLMPSCEVTVGDKRVRMFRTSGFNPLVKVVKADRPLTATVAEVAGVQIDNDAPNVSRTIMEQLAAMSRA